MQNGLVHIYCGDGKGKTTAAVGLCTRAAGNGMTVAFTQFLKSSDSSERIALSSFKNVFVPEIPSDTKFVKHMNEQEFNTTKIFFLNLFDSCVELATSGKYDLLVLDEIFSTVSHGIISNEQLASLITNKSKNTELVLTGRNPDNTILGLADYVTEMRLIKHPFQQGIYARKGIEY